VVDGGAGAGRLAASEGPDGFDVDDHVS
jgi:hypothetical protein